MADIAGNCGRFRSVGSAMATARTETDAGGPHFALEPSDMHAQDDGSFVRQADMPFKHVRGAKTAAYGNCAISPIAAMPGAHRAAAGGGEPRQNAEISVEGLATRDGMPVGHIASGALVKGFEQRQTTTVELARVTKHLDSRDATHMRNEGERSLEVMDETLRTPREASVHTHVPQHTDAAGHYRGKIRLSLAKIDAARTARPWAAATLPATTARSSQTRQQSMNGRPPPPVSSESPGAHSTCAFV